jgi:hypothetical protein
MKSRDVDYFSFYFKISPIYFINMFSGGELTRGGKAYACMRFAKIHPLKFPRTFADNTL